MNKICTDLEQSKQLQSLGIDVYSADMYWKNGVSDKYIQCLTPFVGSGTDMDYDYDIPPWSLSALLELIPERIPGTKLVIKWDGSYYIEGRDCLFDNAIDAAFEIVVWLKENGKI